MITYTRFYTEKLKEKVKTFNTFLEFFLFYINDLTHNFKSQQTH